MASVATAGHPLFVTTPQGDEKILDSLDLRVHGDFDQVPKLQRVERKTRTAVNGRTYELIDVRCLNSNIIPKEELLANFLVPQNHHLGTGPSHSIYTADGVVAPVHHAMATRRLPTEILYDNEGLRLFDEITRMESHEYYLTSCEENILQNQMERIIPLVPDGCAIVELGCGSMAKTAIFLDGLRKAGKKDICFYAIDIEKESLENSLESLIEFEQQNDSENSFSYHGILGSYDQALETNVLKNISRPKVILWLGSSIGNWTRDDATDFLRKFSADALKPFDLFMIGIDQRNDPLAIARAYNDSAGITRDFGLNGLRHLNKLLGQAVFDDSSFEYFAGYNINIGRHEAYFRSKKDQKVYVPDYFDTKTKVIEIKQGELINYEFSYKYSVDEIHHLCDRAHFHLSELLTDSSKRYNFAVLSKPIIEPVPRVNVGRSRFPQLDEFEQVWKLWHTLTSPAVITDPLETPIQLRHPLVFYVGHIPAFEDIYMSRHFNEPLTEPCYFAKIFERGINPVVEDPTKCHAHSEVPDEWPDISVVRTYDAVVHNRVRSIYEQMTAPTGNIVKPGMQRLGRQLAICLEHTIMHAETYIYMLVQLNRALLPKSFMPGYLRSETYVVKPLRAASWVSIQPSAVKRGIPNYERDDDKTTMASEIEYGWDNETPVRTYEVKNAFEAQSRPVTCGEYMDFLKTLPHNTGTKYIPASWVVQENGTYAMRTLFGPIEISKCCNCPVTLSYKHAEVYGDYLRATHKNPCIRIPTEEEWVVMQSQLKRDDCHEDMDFMNWMPAPLKENVHHTVGSVWEWTSTVFDSYEGFEQSKLYPGYSSDFFDGLHNVVRGASWCTHGRVASRLRNFYQRSYPYAFIGVRFVRDKLE